MSESLRARDSFIDSHLDLFRFVVEIGPRTAVPAAPTDADSPSSAPYYDRQRRELSADGVIVKRFSRRAKNQELILLAFQEENWPPRIDDPLPGGCLDAIKRLHDTLDSLNGRRDGQAPACRVHFFSDGTGEGVRWRVMRH